MFIDGLLILMKLGNAEFSIEGVLNQANMLAIGDSQGLDFDIKLVDIFFCLHLIYVYNVYNPQNVKQIDG